MTVYTALHGVNGSLADSVHLFHLSMASRTRHFCRNVALVTKIDKVGQIVDLDPFDSTSRLPVLAEFLDLRLVFPDIFMTAHALLHGRDSRHNRPARIDMAVEAINLIVAGMELVTESDGLYGCCCPGREAENGYRYCYS